MANKREFKKYVDAIGASVIDEMTPHITMWRNPTKTR